MKFNSPTCFPANAANMKHFLILLLLFAYLPLSAQQQAKDIKRSCRVLFLNKPADAPGEAYLFDGKNSHKISLSSMNFSKVVELPRGALPDGTLTIGLTSEKVNSPEEFPRGAPSVTLPATATDIYLLLASDPSNSVFPIAIRPLNVDDSKLKAGETLWINLTKHKVAAKLGESQFFIDPMKQTVGPPPLEESGYYKAQFIYQREGKGDFLPIMRKSWWFDATSKNLGFVISSGARLPKIFTFRDRRSPESESDEGETDEPQEI